MENRDTANFTLSELLACRGAAHRAKRSTKFTLIELLVVITIITILSALLLPALSMARYRARDVLCRSNCKQLGIVLTVYADDFNGYYPTRDASASKWYYISAWTHPPSNIRMHQVMEEYLTPSPVQTCPMRDGSYKDWWPQWDGRYRWAAYSIFAGYSGETTSYEPDGTPHPRSEWSNVFAERVSSAKLDYPILGDSINEQSPGDIHWNTHALPRVDYGCAPLKYARANYVYPDGAVLNFKNDFAVACKSGNNLRRYWHRR